MTDGSSRRRADAPAPEPPSPGTPAAADGPSRYDGSGLGALIREHRRRQHRSMRALAAVAGISNPYLSQIERGLRRPSADVLRHLARALTIPVEVLYVEAGLLEDAPDPDHRCGHGSAPGREGAVIAAIRADEALRPDLREHLVEEYRRARARSGTPVAESTGGQGR